MREGTPLIYLLRHGETVWNTLGRFQGQLDSPLTRLGIEQADAVAGLLRAEIAGDAQSFEMQVSPLGRARETAARVQRLLPLARREDARLMEVSVGCWDGLTRFEIDMEFPGNSMDPTPSTGISGLRTGKDSMPLAPGP